MIATQAVHTAAGRDLIGRRIEALRARAEQVAEDLSNLSGIGVAQTVDAHRSAGIIRLVEAADPGRRLPQQVGFFRHDKHGVQTRDRLQRDQARG